MIVEVVGRSSRYGASRIVYRLKVCDCDES
jgi:hypothetical protein